MRNSTRPAEDTLREEFYETRWGVGRVLLAGDLPLEADLPDPARTAPAGAPRGRWAAALERYFTGEPVVFTLDVGAFADAHGYTRFERDVAAALARVPRGAAVSYRDLAHAAGRPNAYRAVGSVMARNPLPIILPCHRVIHNDGTLGSYGDDPAWKQRLLGLEGWSPGGEKEPLRRRDIAEDRVRPSDASGGGEERSAAGRGRSSGAAGGGERPTTTGGER